MPYYLGGWRDWLVMLIALVLEVAWVSFFVWVLVK